MRKIICKVFGHTPTGPIYTKNFGVLFVYGCKRCKRPIKFINRKGWVISDE